MVHYVVQWSSLVHALAGHVFLLCFSLSLFIKNLLINYLCTPAAIQITSLQRLVYKKQRFMAVLPQVDSTRT